MKKIITILLALTMMLSVMPISAMADEITVSSDSVFGEELDYSAYDSIVKLVAVLDEKEYTKESISNVKSKIPARENLITQKQINDAVAEIASACSELEKNSFTIEFYIVDSNGEMQKQTFVYTYGEEFTLNADNGEEPYKWVISTDDSDTKIESNAKEITLVADKACAIIAYTDIKPEVKEQLQQVKFLSANGKPVYIAYTTNPDEVEMPEAPELPFCRFSEWVKLNDHTYQASYLSDSICDGIHHRFKMMIAEAGCETVGYLIFQCSCGEAYRTDYTRPVGHDFDNEHKYCNNGCGTLNPNRDDYESSTPEESTTPDAPTKPEEPEKEDEYIFDEGGYSNVVIAP